MSNARAALLVALGVAALARAAPARAQARAPAAVTVFLRERGAPARVAAAPPGAVDPARARRNVAPAPPDDAATTTRALAAARDAVAAAQRAFLESRFADAATGARAAFAQHAFALARAHRGALAELALWAGASHALAGAADAAREDFAQALALAPGFAAPAGVFPLEVEALFAEVQRARASAMPAAVTVRCVPHGARIEVDGAPAGAAPTTLTLAPGPHLLRVERVGYLPFRGVVRAQGGGLQTQEIVLVPASGAALRAQLEADPAGLPEVPDGPALAAIRAEYRAAAVLVVRRDGSLLRDPPARPRPGGVPAWPFIVGGAAAVVAVGAVITGVLIWNAQPISAHNATPGG